MTVPQVQESESQAALEAVLVEGRAEVSGEGMSRIKIRISADSLHFRPGDVPHR
jgi:hypothetical protein